LFEVVGRLFVAARHRQSEQTHERHGHRSNSFHSGNCWFLITRIPVMGLVKNFRGIRLVVWSARRNVNVEI